MILMTLSDASKTTVRQLGIQLMEKYDHVRYSNCGMDNLRHVSGNEQQ